MPFTPFHMGAALIVKPGLNRKFSVITFGLAQVAMDIEPGIGMLTGADVLHGPTHTILGALVIAYLVMLMAPRVCNYLLQEWNKEVVHHRLNWLVQPETSSKTAVAVGAFFGTVSHVGLDSLMHHDLHPLSPFSQANPLMGLVSHDGVYQLCAIAGAIGAVTWVAMQWFRRPTQVDVAAASPKPLKTTINSTPWFQVDTLTELQRPWKLATLAIGIGLLVVGSFYYEAPDWDIPISFIMALMAYLTASWSVHVMVERRWRQWPLMLFWTWFTVDGSYWLYWHFKNPVALELMRDANAPASLSLYWMCGLVWFYRGTLHSMWGDLNVGIDRVLRKG